MDNFDEIPLLRYFYAMSLAVQFEIPELHELARVQVDAESRVISLLPFEEETYGLFRNRAPHLTGKVAVAGFTSIQELWPGIIIAPADKPTQPQGELYVAGFSPYEYHLIVSHVLRHRF